MSQIIWTIEDVRRAWQAAIRLADADCLEHNVDMCYGYDDDEEEENKLNYLTPGSVLYVSARAPRGTAEAEAIADETYARPRRTAPVLAVFGGHLDDLCNKSSVDESLQRFVVRGTNECVRYVTLVEG